MFTFTTVSSVPALEAACGRKDTKSFRKWIKLELPVARDVVTYNAVLDAVSSQIALGRKLFQEGVEKGFYARVSRVGTQWFELDFHFLSLGGGEIALDCTRLVVRRVSPTLHQRYRDTPKR
jgi:hypothetical protein